MNPRYLSLIPVALAVVAPLVLPAYYITLMNFIGLAAIVVIGLVLLTGIGGLTSFGQAAFVGVGHRLAYRQSRPFAVVDHLCGYRRNCIFRLADRSSDAEAFRPLSAALDDCMEPQPVLPRR